MCVALTACALCSCVLVQVSGPGGYRFLDFTRFGLPLQFVAALITVPICVLYFEPRT